ncbi:MAG: hypothetical protein L6Q40_09560, partial [Azonexus sp.]|nr:hypothetical protein [Azonexus sp.]
MSTASACPQCTLENTYPDGSNFVCADCGFEWPQADNAAEDEGERIVKDANGNVLVSGDSVVRSGSANQDIRLSEISASMGDGNRLPRSRKHEKTPPQPHSRVQGQSGDRRP